MLENKRGATPSYLLGNVQALAVQALGAVVFFQGLVRRPQAGAGVTQALGVFWLDVLWKSLPQRKRDAVS